MKRLLLAGGGQAHVFVLRALAKQHPGQLEVTLVTPSERLLYSGMLPGWLAGHYRLADLMIPLAPLAQAAGARLLTGCIVALDLARKTATLDTGATIPFDVVSIATGATLDLDAIEGARTHSLPLRPLERFIAGYEQILQRASASSRPLTLTVVGGGAGGVELALAAAFRFNSIASDATVQLVTGGDSILPSHGTRARGLMRRALSNQHVRVIDAKASRIDADTITLDSGASIASDATLLVTGAAADPWFAAAGFATDKRGFIAVGPTLQSTSHHFVFAAGDAAAMMDSPRPKSGVYAVRAGPRLAQNILALLEQRPLTEFAPQKRALYLLATGPKHAVASWGPWAFDGDWVWRWKNRIDRGYIAKFKAAE